MPDDLPVHGQPDEVMRALAIELASLQNVAISLESCMTQVMQSEIYGDSQGADRQLMQDFDLLTQSLDGLRVFVDQLATAARGWPSIRLNEALATIKLADMRERLANHDPHAQILYRTPAATEIDLF